MITTNRYTHHTNHSNVSGHRRHNNETLIFVSVCVLWFERRVRVWEIGVLTRTLGFALGMAWSLEFKEFHGSY